MPERLTYRWSPISKNEASLLRALAILAIIFHNYLHHVCILPGENEFGYSAGPFQALADGLRSTPWDFFRLLSSYFGHYGVQVFFFLSGYGLVAKYGDTPPAWWSFQKSRWAKLYPAIIAAALGFLLYESIRIGWTEVIHADGANLIRQMLGISNFLPDNIYHPIGPWWFIGVILQFYLLLPLILQWTKKSGNKPLYILMAFSLLAEWLLGPLLSRYFDFNINHSVFGHLDVCALGMLFARKKDFRIPSFAIALAGLLFVAGNLNAVLWVTTGLSVIFIALPLLRVATGLVSRFQLLNTALLFTGQLSMYMFLCNGYLRQPLIREAQASPHWWTSLWTSLLFLTIVYAWSLILRAGVKHSTRLWKRM